MTNKDDSIVTEKDHQEGMDYMRRTQFYETLCRCIDNKDLSTEE